MVTKANGHSLTTQISALQSQSTLVQVSLDFGISNLTSFSLCANSVEISPKTQRHTSLGFLSKQGIRPPILFQIVLVKYDIY